MLWRILLAPCWGWVDSAGEDPKGKGKTSRWILRHEGFWKFAKGFCMECEDFTSRCCMLQSVQQREYLNPGSHGKPQRWAVCSISIGLKNCCGWNDGSEKSIFVEPRVQFPLLTWHSQLQSQGIRDTHTHIYTVIRRICCSKVYLTDISIALLSLSHSKTLRDCYVYDSFLPPSKER